MRRIALHPLAFAWISSGCFVAGSDDGVADSSTGEEIGTAAESSESGTSGTSTDTDPTTDATTEETGEPQPEPGDLAWSLELGAIVPTGATANSQGKITVAGNLLETTDLALASGPLEVQGGSDIALLQLDATNALAAGTRAGGSGAEYANTYALAPNDHVVLGGIYEGMPDFGSGTLPAPSMGAGFNGVLLEVVGTSVTNSVPLIGSGVVVRGIDVNGSGNTIATGEYQAALDVVGHQIMSAGGSDGFYLRIDPQGAGVTDLVSLGGVGPDAGSLALFDGLGGIYLVGQFSESVALGPANLVAAGARDVFVARAATNGNVMWVKRLGGSGADSAWSGQVDDDGSLVLVGSFENELDYDGSPIASSGGASDAYLLRIAADGQLEWSVTLPGPGASIARCVGIAANGDIDVGGEVFGAVDLGGGNTQGEGQLDALVARFDSSGTFIVGSVFGSSNDDRITSLGYDGEGRVVMGLSHNGDVQLDADTLLPAPGMPRGALIAYW